MAEPHGSPGKSMTQMLLGNRVQQAVYVAAKLGIADLLDDGPKSSRELASATGAHPEALYRLLRALTGFGVFAEAGLDRFELTPLSAQLRKGIRESKRAFALWSGGLSYELFGGLEYSVMTGRPAFDHMFGMEFFEYLKCHPDVGRLFDEFMSRQTAPLGSVMGAYDFGRAETVVDVAGGRGELLAATLQAHPAIRGVLIDEQRVVEGAQGVLEAAGVATRCSVVVGDMFEAVPGGDVFILKSIVHSLSDEESIRLLGNCRKAASGSDAKLIIIELVMPPGNEPHPAKLMDLLMLVGTHEGRERTAEELRTLLAAGGWELCGVMPTKYAYSLIEAVPADPASSSPVPRLPVAARVPG